MSRRQSALQQMLLGTSPSRDASALNLSARTSVPPMLVRLLPLVSYFCLVAGLGRQLVASLGLCAKALSDQEETTAD